MDSPIATDAKRLLLKLCGGTVITTLGFYVRALAFAGSKTDEYHLRFTTPLAPSLALGSSRAAQAIAPRLFYESAIDFQRPMYNFSFTAGHSPFGPTYLRSIEKARSSVHERAFSDLG